MICYHGTTDKGTYDLIMREGVKKRSYWSPFLSAALKMGGPYIIGVFFPDFQEKNIANGEWQFFNARIVKPCEFIVTMKYTGKMLTYNQEANRKMRKYLRKQEGGKWCKNCDGRGEMTYLDNGHDFLIGGSRFDNKVYKKPTRKGNMVICHKCLGRG